MLEQGQINLFGYSLGGLWNKFANLEDSARNNGFDWSTTANQVVEAENVDMRGKTVLITGATSGIGKETARVLASRGANLILACRNQSKMEDTANQLRAMGRGASVRCVALDLCSLRSVRQCAHEINQSGGPIHVLVCNAGVLGLPYQETEDGIETHFEANYLGHYLLTSLLMQRLVEAGNARIVLVASMYHNLGRLDVTDINGRGTWFKWGSLGRLTAYCRSKTAVLLFAKELSRRLHEAGHVHMTVNALHPGLINTPLYRYCSLPAYLAHTVPAAILGKSIPQGAATTVFACASEKMEGISGRYLSDCNLARPASHASDPILARSLWELSEKVTHADWSVIEKGPAAPSF